MDIDFEEVGRRSGRSRGEVLEFIRNLKEHMVSQPRIVSVKEKGDNLLYELAVKGIGILNLPEGYFHLYNIIANDQWRHYKVLFYGQVDKRTFMPVFKNKGHIAIRIDSGCESGQLYGDRTCECAGQLHKFLKSIKEQGEGMVIHMPTQDGRGKGTAFKLGTLMLQHYLKVNTIESATLMAIQEPIDVRTYGGVIAVLKYFGISGVKIDVATNNPDKLKVLEENDYKIERMPLIIKPTKFTKKNLQAKKRYRNHIL